jgi:opacity protein-like surface antigen
MKSLRTLALLPLAAAAAQAYTIELQLGQSRSTGYDTGTVSGLNIAGQVSQSVSLGLNLSNKTIKNSTPQSMTVRNASLDLTYEMNPRGALHPFFGAGVGYAWLSDAATFTNSKGVTTTSIFGGMRFELSRSVDIAFNYRHNQLLSVPNTAGANKNTIKNWDSTVGLRFKF